jgi:hypothetical protein
MATMVDRRVLFAELLMVFPYDEIHTIIIVLGRAGD